MSLKFKSERFWRLQGFVSTLTETVFFSKKLTSFELLSLKQVALLLFGWSTKNSKVFIYVCKTWSWFILGSCRFKCWCYDQTVADFSWKLTFIQKSYPCSVNQSGPPQKNFGGFISYFRLEFLYNVKRKNQSRLPPNFGGSLLWFTEHG